MENHKYGLFTGADKKEFLKAVKSVTDINFYEILQSNFQKKVVEEHEELSLLARLGILQYNRETTRRVNALTNHVQNFLIVGETGPIILN